MKDFFQKYKPEIFFVATAVVMLIVFIAIMMQIGENARSGGAAW